MSNEQHIANDTAIFHEIHNLTDRFVRDVLAQFDALHFTYPRDSDKEIRVAVHETLHNACVLIEKTRIEAKVTDAATDQQIDAKADYDDYRYELYRDRSIEGLF